MRVGHLVHHEWSPPACMPRQQARCRARRLPVPQGVRAYLECALSERVHQAVAALAHRQDVGRADGGAGVHACGGRCGNFPAGLRQDAHCRQAMPAVRITQTLLWNPLQLWQRQAAPSSQQCVLIAVQRSSRSSMPAAHAWAQRSVHTLTVLKQALGCSQHLVGPRAAALPHHLQQALHAG